MTPSARSEADEELIDELFDAFENPIDFPFEAVAKAKANWPIVGIAFIQEIEDAVADPWAYVDDMLFEFAYRLASDMRDTRAFALLVSILHLPDDAVDALIGEGITGTYGRALACTFDKSDGASQARLRGVAKNLHLLLWSRLAAVDAECIRAHEGDADAEDVVRWIHGLCLREVDQIRAGCDDSTGLELLVYHLLDFGAVDCLPDIEQWWSTLTPSPYREKIDHIRTQISTPRNARATRFNRYCTDLTEEFATWATFTDERERDARAALDDNEFNGYPEEELMPFIRAAPKVGRNEPCPCRSGLKFKKCCGKDG